MTPKRVFLVVAVCAAVVYLGALWNRFAFDDLPIVLWNSLFRQPGAWRRAFASSYWPPEMGGGMYRPLTVASYAVDWLVARAAWFHAVNLLWHAGTSVAVAALARRWAGDNGALAAGLVFAVHPVHVEAVANIAGRAELMAALFAVLAVYAALARDRIGWSALAGALALLCKENGAVVPALIAWGWIVGLARPSRQRVTLYAVSWIGVGVLYAIVRESVLRPYAGVFNVAAQFVGASPLQIRLTAMAAFADFARLLVFPRRHSARLAVCAGGVVPARVGSAAGTGVAAPAQGRGVRTGVDRGGVVARGQPVVSGRSVGGGADVVPAVGRVGAGGGGGARGVGGAGSGAAATRVGARSRRGDRGRAHRAAGSRMA